MVNSRVGWNSEGPAFIWGLGSGLSGNPRRPMGVDQPPPHPGGWFRPPHPSTPSSRISSGADFQVESFLWRQGAEGFFLWAVPQGGVDPAPPPTSRLGAHPALSLAWLGFITVMVGLCSDGWKGLTFPLPAPLPTLGGGGTVLPGQAASPRRTPAPSPLVSIVWGEQLQPARPQLDEVPQASSHWRWYPGGGGTIATYRCRLLFND